MSLASILGCICETPLWGTGRLSRVGVVRGVLITLTATAVVAPSASTAEGRGCFYIAWGGPSTPKATGRGSIGGTRRWQTTSRTASKVRARLTGEGRGRPVKGATSCVAPSCGGVGGCGAEKGCRGGRPNRGARPRGTFSVCRSVDASRAHAAAPWPGGLTGTRVTSRAATDTAVAACPTPASGGPSSSAGTVRKAAEHVRRARPHTVRCALVCHWGDESPRRCAT